MFILGVTGYAGTDSHDASACLLKDGQLIVAIEQERLSRRKHSVGESPSSAVRACLDFAGIELTDVSAIATGWYDGPGPYSIVKAGPRFEWASIVLPTTLFPEQEIPTVYFIKHHLSHIAAGFFLSGFESATCICVDGQGEEESISIARARGLHIDIMKSYGKMFSLGALYEATAEFAGLGFNVPGKLMGLAPYGKSQFDIPLVFDKRTGSFSNGIMPAGSQLKSAECVVSSYIDYFLHKCYPYKMGDGDDIFSYVNCAASVQAHIEHIIADIVEYATTLSHEPNVVLVGGVALNCNANAKVEQLDNVRNLYVPPAPNDASCSVGAALYVDKIMRRTSGIQPAFTKSQIGLSYENDRLDGLDPMPTEVLCKQVSKDLSENKIVAWFQGRSEFGPRALGGRSLLASATRRENLVKLNRIKGREVWRPLAPSVMKEHYESYFDSSPTFLDYMMLKTVMVKKERQLEVPAIVHIDGTARPQAVDSGSHEKFYKVLNKYYQLTGVPMLINTSLNLSKMPIVESPRHAIEVFLKRPEIDVLVIDNMYMNREKSQCL